MAIVVVWNPAFPFQVAGRGWMAAHVVVAAFLVIGLFLRVPDRSQASPRRS